MSVVHEKFLKLMSRADRASLGKAGMTKAEAEAVVEVKNERELQRLIVNYLRLHGIEPLWFRTDKRTTATLGWPDITFCVWPIGKAKIPCVWEVKFDKGKLSEVQHEMLVKLQDDGWRHRVITSFEQARAELGEMGVDCKN